MKIPSTIRACCAPSDIVLGAIRKYGGQTAQRLAGNDEAVLITSRALCDTHFLYDEAACSGRQKDLEMLLANAFQHHLDHLLFVKYSEPAASGHT